MTHNLKRLRRNNKALSPAFSTMILTASAIVMILVAMSYASDILNLKVAENEFSSNKQFMATSGQQLDDIAWTIGRTQTIDYTSRFGALKFEPAVLTYDIGIHTSSGWRNQSITTGVVLYNMPVSSYALSDGYFERVPRTANNSIIQFGSKAPVCQVFALEKLSMAGEGCVRIALAPTLRVLNASFTGSYLKFYLPNLHNGDSPYLSQSLTFKGDGISKTTQDTVDLVQINVAFPKAAMGFDADFFHFGSSQVTLNANSTPKLVSGSVVEIYAGDVSVQIGAN